MSDSIFDRLRATIDLPQEITDEHEKRFYSLMLNWHDTPGGGPHHYFPTLVHGVYTFQHEGWTKVNRGLMEEHLIQREKVTVPKIHNTFTYFQKLMRVLEPDLQMILPRGGSGNARSRDLYLDLLKMDDYIPLGRIGWQVQQSSSAAMFSRTKELLGSQHGVFAGISTTEGEFQFETQNRRLHLVMLDLVVSAGWAVGEIEIHAAHRLQREVFFSATKGNQTIIQGGGCAGEALLRLWLNISLTP